MTDDSSRPAGGSLALGALIAYTLVFALGIVAEAFDIQWILAWPIF